MRVSRGKSAVDIRAAPVDAHPDARVDDLVQRVVEAIESALRRRRQRKLAGHRAVALGSDYDCQPSLERSNKVYLYKTIVARALRRRARHGDLRWRLVLPQQGHRAHLPRHPGRAL